ncbi:MAG: YybS family protein [Desulfobacterales bacterium]|jgi:uncharacterized protein YybS (DUF2232 family)
MVKDIANGILITSLLVFLSVFIPIVGFVCALFIPLPILFYRSKLGRTAGAVIPATSGVAMVFLIGGLSFDVLFFVELLLIGFILGELFALNLTIEKTTLYASGGVLLCGLIGLVGSSSVSGESIYTIVSQYVTENLELTMVLYRNMGMSEENIQLISNSLDKIQYVLVRIVPALVVMSTVSVVWANILLAKPILESRSLFYPDFGPLNMWKAPDFLVWAAIGCGLALFLPNTTIKMISLNGLLILMIVYFFQGIAIVSYFFEKKKFPRIIRIVLYSLIALQQFILLAVIGLGFFDLWVNFRKLGKQQSP